MTLLFTDGFDMSDSVTKWEAFAPAFNATTRFTSGQSAFLANTSGGTLMMTKTFTAANKIIVGYAYRQAVHQDGVSLMGFYGDAGVTLHTALRILTTGAVQLLRGTTAVATSAAGLVPTSTWVYIEVSATVSDTVGVAEVHVNGVLAATFTGDTRNAGTATTIDAVKFFYGGAASMNIYWDDVYICNGLGTVNNDFLGDVRIQVLRPNGAGSSAQFTPTGSANNWDNVDEFPVSATEYNASSTVGHKDLYAMTTVAAGTSAVHGINTHFFARKTDAGVISAKTLVKAGSTTSAGSAVALATSQARYNTIHELNPDTGVAWTVSDVGSLEAGVEVA